MEVLSPILRCPDCLSSDLAVATDRFVCDKCHRNIKYIDKILDARPKSRIRLPLLYEDKHYLKWQNMWREGHDYSYRSSGPLSWIQMAGHRIISNWRHGQSSNWLLDIGCGDGAHLDFCGDVETYIGLDMDMETLKSFSIREKSGPGDHFAVRGDAYNLPFDNNIFDTIISVYNLEHLAFLDLCLEEVCRVLTDYGSFYISIPNEGGLAWGAGRWLSSKKHFDSLSLNYDRLIEIEHINCIWQIEKAVKRYFKSIKIHRFPLRVHSRHLNLITTLHCQKRLFNSSLNNLG
ncbi:class I SAM-dependent methyltransferase [Dethiosulfatarculus sandiegensis]|uniref:Methyltransferase type 11 domain-containing protein n=1 Tax=Dethiosulfatarculus sandiegensis TaxID=1429043 RepID=A0A0D2HZL1_9BACT|nr:class I SAM-dependent methyltransferase [Dethiosulfatarculus sandiegensis]KIX15718.1 hypothetical protein X474_02710 [Dethiosulfatarculus sandiegensis]